HTRLLALSAGFDPPDIGSSVSCTDAAITQTPTLSLHDALPIYLPERSHELAILWEGDEPGDVRRLTYGELHAEVVRMANALKARSEEHTSELQSRENLVCRLLLEKKKISPTPRISSGTHTIMKH